MRKTGDKHLAAVIQFRSFERSDNIAIGHG